MSENGWTDNIRQYIAEWCDKAGKLSWINDQTADYYDNIEHYMTLTLAILNVASGSAYLLSLLNHSPTLVETIILGIVVIIVGVLTKIKLYVLKFPKRIESYKLVSNDWQQIMNDIEKQQSLDFDKRINGTTFMDLINDRIKIQVERQLHIPDRILMAFKNEFNVSYDSLTYKPIEIVISNPPIYGLRLQADFERNLQNVI